MWISFLILVENVFYDEFAKLWWCYRKYLLTFVKRYRGAVGLRLTVSTKVVDSIFIWGNLTDISHTGTTARI